MLNYEVEISNDTIKENIYTAKNIVYRTIDELIETNWLNGLFTIIKKLDFESIPDKLAVICNISYEIADDEEYKEIQERMEIGL